MNSARTSDTASADDSGGAVSPAPEAAAGERLQKFLAGAGVASRRAAEELIRAGRVAVNGVVVTELGSRVDADRDEVRVDGRIVSAPTRQWYVMLNKPTGVVTTLDDPQGRPTVAGYVPAGAPRLFPVGRLDVSTTGLLILTNDGDLAHALMHPRHHVPKTYRAVVDGVPDSTDLRQLREGIELDDGVTAPAEARVVSSARETAVVELVLREGRKRQVRRMLSVLGHPVRALDRIAYGPLALGDLPRGAVRELDAAEVAALRGASRVVG